MAETLLVFRADEQFSALQHLLYHDACCARNLHHTVELEGKVLGSAYVQCHTAYVALMDRPYDLGHDGIACLLGKGDELVFRGGHLFRHHRDAGAREYLTHRVRSKIAAGDTLKLQ